MKYLTFSSLIASAFAAKSFGTLLIRSGSPYQYTQFAKSGSNIMAGSENVLSLLLEDDGTLRDKNSQKYIHIGDDAYVTLSDEPQDGYSIFQNYLVYQGENTFSVCSGSRVAFGKTSDDCLSVSVRVERLLTESASASSTKSKSTEAAKTAKASTPTKVSTSTETTGSQFGLKAVSSGSKVDNARIKKVDSHPHVFSVGGSEGNDLLLNFQDDKTSLVDQTGRGVNLDQTTGELGNVAPFGRAPATTGFSIEANHLAYNGNQGWKACPSGENKYSLSNKDCTGGIDIVLEKVGA